MASLKKISIHALVKRATELQAELYINKGISIHALVKRATQLRFILFLYSSYFNPRPREEGDVFPAKQTTHRLKFQSTPS